MGNLIKRNKGFSLAGLLVMIVFLIIGLIAIYNPQKNTDALAGQQGDRVWTATPPLATTLTGTDGAGSYTRGVAFPYDSNAQPVIYYIEATGNTDGDPVDVYAYISNVTTYTTLLTAYCGGTTVQARVADASMTQVTSGVSYVVIDNGAGNCGWAELAHGKNLNNGAYGLIFKAGASNMGSPAGNTPNLSGVTYPVGARVFPLVKIGTMPITTANSNTAKDNNTGLFAASKGSPIFVVNQDATTGVTIHTVTVGYK